jgi:hypothetical protein
MNRFASFLFFTLILASVGWAKPLVPRERTAILPAAKAPDLIRAVCYSPPAATGYWTPAESDLEGIEDTLLVYLRSQKIDENDWSEFRKQVTGIKRGDDALIFIYYFHFDRGIEEYLKAKKVRDYDPDSWKKEPYRVFDGGRWFFRVLYDVKKKQFIWYECNGSA